MRNPELGRDYVRRAEARIKALDVLFAEKSWADVVRESQEIVELALKGLLRIAGIEPPRIHDVSEVLRSEYERLSPQVHSHLDELCEASRSLRRDRELAFYGAEDLTPSEFYTESDASQARAQARAVVERVATSANLR